MFLGIGVDLIVLVIAKMALEQDDSPDWRGLGIAVTIIAVVNFLIMLALANAIGYLVLAPMLIVATLGLMFLCQMTVRNAAIAAAAMVVARFLLMLLTR
jgi:hypothetical protein